MVDFLDIARLICDSFGIRYCILSLKKEVCSQKNFTLFVPTGITKSISFFFIKSDIAPLSKWLITNEPEQYLENLEISRK